MKKMPGVLSVGMLLVAIGASGVAHASGQWVCPSGALGGFGVYTPGSGCWFRSASIQYRGKEADKSVDAILKEAKISAEKEAAELDGDELRAAGVTALTAGDVAAIRAKAFRDRASKITAEDKKMALNLEERSIAQSWATGEVHLVHAVRLFQGKA